MSASTRRGRRPLRVVRKPAADFSDAESQRTLSAMARAVAGELGRQAAREDFARILAASKQKVS